MTAVLDSILEFASASPFVALTLKATFLLAVGTGISLVVHRSAAATRHLVWMLTLSSIVAIALVSALGPALPVPVSSLAATAAPSVDAPDGTRAIEVRTGREVVTILPGEDGTGTPASQMSGTTPATTPAGRAVSRLPGLAFVIWLCGAAVIALRLLIGQAGLIRLVRAATPLALPASERNDPGLSSNPAVRFFRSSRVGSPLTWGFVRPVVLLPDDVDSWSAERRRVVLAHELAHVDRRDSLAQWIAGAACAVYWFHPLVWLAARRLRIESEIACDDRVLSTGTTGVDYATHLIDVARHSRERGINGILAIGMARRSQLEGRLLAILDECRSRGVPKPRGRAASWAATALVVLPLAAVRAVPPATAERAAPPIVTVRAAPSAPAGSPVDLAQRSDYSRQRDRNTGDYDFDRTLPAMAGETLVLELDSGGSVHVSGWNESQVSVRARLGGQDWRDTEIEFERDGDDLRLRAYQAVDRSFSSTSHQFDIRVPRRFNLDIKSAGGEINLEDLEGDFSGSTGGGRVSIRKVEGRTVITTGGGEIEVIDSSLDGRVTTGGGMVRLSRVRGGLRGSSGSGPVIYVESDGEETGDLDEVVIDADGIHVSTDGHKDNHKSSHKEDDDADLESRDGVIHIEKAGGSINLRNAPQGADVSTGGGEIRVGRAGGPVRATTGAGKIEIGPVDGPVHASTGFGDIEVIVARGPGDHSVSASTGTGSVIIELPADFSGTFQLETAYTDNFDRKTRIDSDWELEHRESRDWDDSHGTPRKKVQARGRIGSGENLISVSIVNGDITIRKRR